MKNDKLLIGSETWLVLQNMEDFSFVIQLNIDKLIVKKLKTELISDGIEKGEIKLELSYSKSNKIIDLNAVTGVSKEKIDLSIKIFEYLNDKYDDLDWLINRNERASEFKNLVIQFNINYYTLRRRLIDYLQGGMTITSLISQYYNCGVKERKYINKKPGPKKGSMVIRDEKIEKIFEIMKKRYLAGGAKMPFTRLHEEMVFEFYSDKRNIGGELRYFSYPLALIPSVYSLRNWILTHTDEVEREIRRQGKRAARNNIRPTFSDTIDYLDVKTIGSRYEMDEVETDFYLVNRRYRNRVIGRAIVYFIVDVFSRAIVACGIGLDNNSWSGAEVALLNMVENKKEFCSRYGKKIDESEWPMMNVIPSSMIVDNGAEYLSNNFSGLTNTVGIGIDYVPPQMGSFKGNVEKKFDQMNSRFKGYLPGAIEKDKYGQPHIKNARLDIAQFGKAVIEFILEYNNNPMDNYPVTADMFENDFIPTPINIWNFNLTRYNELKYIHDIESYKYNLLKHDTALITRNGIEYGGRYFICNDMEWLSRKASLAALTGSEKLPIRYDMSYTDVIYYEIDGYRYKAFLNCPEVINGSYEIEKKAGFKTSNSRYVGLIEPEIRDMNEKLRQQKIVHKEIKLNNKINTKAKLKEISVEAISAHIGVNDKHGIDENRSEEKEMLHIEQHITVHENSSIKLLPEFVENISQEDKLLESVDFKKMSRAEKFRWFEQHKRS
jgi:hypothetical protein